MKETRIFLEITKLDNGEIIISTGGGACNNGQMMSHTNIADAIKDLSERAVVEYERMTKEEIVPEQEISDLGVSYGSPDPLYGGIVTNLATLPDKTYFYVDNGNWDGYTDSDDDGNKIIYCGIADKKNPTKDYVRKIVLKNGDKYDAAISKVHNKDI